MSPFQRKKSNINRLIVGCFIFGIILTLCIVYELWEETSTSLSLTQFSAFRGSRTAENSTCEAPRLSLDTDTLRSHFQKLPPLECKEEDEEAEDADLLRDVELEKDQRPICEYEAIGWADDSSFVFSPKFRAATPDLNVNSDLYRVTCFEESTSRIRSNQINDDGAHSKNSSGSLNNESRVNASLPSIPSYLFEATNKPVLSRGENGNQTLARLLFHSAFDEFLPPNNGGFLATKDGKDEKRNRRRVSAKMVARICENEKAKRRSVQLLKKMNHPGAPVGTSVGVEKSLPFFNVAILAFDSLSRLSFERLMPMTYRLFADSGVILKNYHVVGDGTNANVIPLLAGFSDAELPEARIGVANAGTPDGWPLLWKDFSSRGYVTLFAEDSPAMGIFSLRLNGFRSPPVDHYLRPFWLALQSTDLYERSRRFCYGGKKKHRITLDYLEDFLRSYREVPKFGFAMHVELSHASNSPAQHADEDVAAMLERLRVDGRLEDTVFILMSDHGARFDDVRLKVQGKLEERLPMMALMMPPKFRRRYSGLFDNLRDNAAVVSSPFDVHATLQHLLRLTTFGHSRPFPSEKRRRRKGSTLFESLPRDRSCADAGIQDHWCTCLKMETIWVDNAYARACARSVLDIVNDATANERLRCVAFRLTEVLTAQRLRPNDKVLKYYESRDADHRIPGFRNRILSDVEEYRVSFVAHVADVDDVDTSSENDGGAAVFEATVRVHLTADEYVVSGGVDGISRINPYGDQPKCIQNEKPHLRKFCLCRDYLLFS